MKMNLLKGKKKMRSIRDRKRSVTLREMIHIHSAGVRVQDAKKNAWKPYNLQRTAQLEAMQFFHQSVSGL